MKEELLLKIREELQIKKEKILEHNNKVKRIRKLQKDKNVKEFLDLSGLIYEQPSLKKVSNEDLIASIYSKYIHQIDTKDTNDLYVYLGTFAYNYDVDIVHGSNDYRVPYDSKNADYRVYQNIELWGSEQVLLDKCEEFENKHIVINPKKTFYDRTYYAIQRDFFIRAVKVDQESAKRMVLRKYSK